MQISAQRVFSTLTFVKPQSSVYTKQQIHQPTPSADLFFSSASIKPAQPKFAGSSDEQNELNREFHEAIENGRIRTVKALHKEGADLNQPGPDGVTPLGRAAALGNRELVQTLIGLGADVSTMVDDTTKSTVSGSKVSSNPFNSSKTSQATTAKRLKKISNESLAPSDSASQQGSSTVSASRLNRSNLESLGHESLLSRMSRTYAASTLSQNTIRPFQNEPRPAKLVIYRPSQFLGSINSHQIYIDNELRGQISSGGIYSTDIKPGMHSIYLKHSWGMVPPSPIIQTEFKPSEQVKMRFSVSSKEPPLKLRIDERKMME